MNKRAAEDLLPEYFPVTSRWSWHHYAFDDFKVRWDAAAMLVEDVVAIPKHFRRVRDHAHQQEHG